MVLAPGKLQAQVGVDDEAAVIRVFGELEFATRAELDAAVELASHLERDRVVIDLAGLEFLDTEGCRALLDARRTLAMCRKELVLGAGSSAIGRVLELTELSRHFEFV